MGCEKGNRASTVWGDIALSLKGGRIKAEAVLLTLEYYVLYLSLPRVLILALSLLLVFVRNHGASYMYRYRLCAVERTDSKGWSGV